MEPLLESNTTMWPFPFTHQDWEPTPPTVQAYLHTLHQEMGQLHEWVESLEARLKQDSTTSSRRPSKVQKEATHLKYFPAFTDLQQEVDRRASTHYALSTAAPDPQPLERTAWLNCRLMVMSLSCLT